jgi:hypothetical protein
MRNIRFKRRQETLFSPVLKVPRQCSLFLLVDTHLRLSEALGGDYV